MKNTVDGTNGTLDIMQNKVSEIEITAVKTI